MKVPLQEKIAELESRIRALEERHARTTTDTTTTRTIRMSRTDGTFDALWKRVDAVFEELGKVFR